MKNPIERIFKEHSLASQMYGKISKLAGKLDKEMDAIGKKFKKELVSIEKKAKNRLKKSEMAALWKKGGYDKLVVKVRKRTDALMKEARKDYKLAMSKLGK